MSIKNPKYTYRGYPIKFKSSQDILALPELKLENGKIPYDYYKDLEFFFQKIALYDITSNLTLTQTNEFQFNNNYLRLNNVIDLHSDFTIFFTIYFDNIIQQQTIFTNRKGNNGISLQLNPFLYNKKIIIRYNNNIFTIDNNVLRQNLYNRFSLIKSNNELHVIINNFYKAFQVGNLSNYSLFCIGSQILQDNNTLNAISAVRGKIKGFNIWSRKLQDEKFLFRI